MNRLDRALGILLLLRGGQTVSAAKLARRFEVSPRTIYRDVEALGELGIPVYTEMGRGGGFRLLEGYFLPPVMFAVNEAVSLLLGLTFARRLRAKPFAEELDTAERKLLAAVPEHLRAALAKAQRIIGFESAPADIFHPEQVGAQPGADPVTDEGRVVSMFVQAILERRCVVMRYRSPYSGEVEAREVIATPRGVLWDRDRWYLAGNRAGRAETRLWRADRVLTIRLHHPSAEPETDFDVAALLDRRWLRAAMERWIKDAPVKIRLTSRQAERLKQDWYYRYARFEPLGGDAMLMTYGEENQAFVFELLRWLGPGAELLEPQAWRATLKEELARMAAAY